jgi:hypothetical protein
MITLDWFSKTTRPNASVGLILEKNINIAYFASSILQPSPFEVKPLPIEPETSSIITALRCLLSLYAPSLLPLVNTAK